MLKKQGLTVTGDNVRGALWAIGKNTGYIKQGLGRLKGKTAR